MKTILNSYTVRCSIAYSIILIPFGMLMGAIVGFVVDMRGGLPK